MKSRLFKGILFALSFSTMVLSVPSQAALIGTTQVIAQQTLLQKTDINAIFDRKEVQQKLTELGVNANEAKIRVANLTNAQVAKINSQINDLPAGGDILGLAVTVFVVLIITDMLGATDIFPFVKKIK